MRNYLRVLPLVFVVTAGCAKHAGVHAQSAPPMTGQAIVMGAASCWLGGLWSDALGEKKLAWNDTRTPGIDRRCKDVLEGEGMRAIDPRAVDAVAHKLDDDGQRTLLREIAAGARENQQARRVADRVKADYADDTTMPSERKNDKLFAGPVLRKSDGLVALLHDSGPHASDAQAIGLLLALDRVEIARGLPKHLKIDVLAAPCREVFGVAPPTVSTDDAAPLPNGTWLSYLTVVASAAGHAIPQEASNDPAHREPLAWNGVLEGFADKLRALQSHVGSTSLAQVAASIATRLDGQYQTERSVALSYAPKKKHGA
jgi:hypothetical protein